MAINSISKMEEKLVEALETPQPTAEQSPTQKGRTTTVAPKKSPSPEKQQNNRKKASPRTRQKDSTLARYQASTIADIRKVVRVIGKEVSFVRFTPGEKQRLGDMVYAYKRQGIKTSENELLRIGLAFLLDDYKTSGKESLLEKVIAALNT